MSKAHQSVRAIRLDQFLKFVGLAPTGGQAKLMVLAGDVMVNGEVEMRRTHKLVPGDKVTVHGQTVTVQLDRDP